MSEKVSIVFKEIDNSQFSCAVVVKSKEVDIKVESITAKARDFKEDALKVCLDIQKAIKFLDAIRN